MFKLLYARSPLFPRGQVKVWECSDLSDEAPVSKGPRGGLEGEPHVPYNQSELINCDAGHICRAWLVIRITSSRSEIGDNPYGHQTVTFALQSFQEMNNEDNR